LLLALSLFLAALGGFLTWSNGNYIPTFEESIKFSPEQLKKRKWWLSIKVAVVVLLLCLAATWMIVWLD
jgi:ribose/xylose/arabinose/galactoside ABC-type transport system permease subunit